MNKLNKIKICALGILLFSKPLYSIPDDSQINRIVNTVKPSLVYIEITAKNTNTDGKEEQQVVNKNGVIISTGGYIVTSYISDIIIADIKVYIDKTECRAKLIGNDKATKISIIKIETDKKLVPAKFGSEPVTANEWLIAIYAMGEEQNFEKLYFPCFVGGILSSGMYKQFYLGIMQSADGIILCNSNNEISGMMLPYYNFSLPLTEKKSDKTAIELNMMKAGIKAVSIGPIKTGISRILSNNKTTKLSWVGIQLKKLSKQEAEGFGIPYKGTVITKIYKNSPAEKAGLIAGDIVIKFNNVELPENDDAMELLIDLLRINDPGAKGTITVRRDDKIMDLTITPIEYPEQKQIRNSWIGITAQEINDLVFNGLNLFAYNGVVVIDVERASPANNAGIEQNDVITAVQNIPVENLTDWRNVINRLNTEKIKNILVKLYRGNKTLLRVIKTGEEQEPE